MTGTLFTTPEPETPRPTGAARSVPTWAGIAIIAVAIAGMFVYPMLTQSPQATGRPLTPSASKLGAFLSCQSSVNDRLRAPASAKYPPATEADSSTRTIPYMGGEAFEVTSYVDSHNGFGALVRTDFLCIVTWQGNNNWKIEQMDIQSR